MQPQTTLPAPAGRTQLAPFEPENIIDALKLAETLAKSALVPKAMQGRPQDILVCMMKGRELGLPPISALSQIHVIEGKACCSSDLIQGIVLASGKCDFFKLLESTAEHAVYEGKRKDSPHVTRIEWTLDDAKRAKLTGKDNWVKYPTAMLRARAAADLAREVWPDVAAGLYDMDEADDIRAEARTAELVDDGRPRRPKTPEELKAQLKAELSDGAVVDVPATAPGKPQDRAEAGPALEPDSSAAAAEPQEQAAGVDEDPFADAETPAPTATFPAEPAAWYDPAKGGIDVSDTSRLELELGVLPSEPVAEWMPQAVWTKGMLKEWTPQAIIFGSEGGKRAKVLWESLQRMKGRPVEQVPRGAAIADYCYALMKLRWELMRAAGLDPAQPLK